MLTSFLCSHSRSAHTLGRDRCTRWHTHLGGHAVGVRVKSSRHAVHHKRTQTLGLRDGAVFMGQQEGLEIHNLLAKLGYRGGKCIVLCREELNLGLEIGEPLLLPLTTFEGRDTIIMLAKWIMRRFAVSV